MEKGGSGVTTGNENNHTPNGSILTAFSLVTVVILSALIGQLVGSSGGTMFMAEFIVTSISLILGGAGTISASAMESWGCFFCLSSMAFWGYLFGRVALMDGIRHKRRVYSTIFLSKSVSFLFCFWILVFLMARWERPIDLVISEPLQQHQSNQHGRLWRSWWFVDPAIEEMSRSARREALARRLQ